jgi:hypothetical protein
MFALATFFWANMVAKRLDRRAKPTTGQNLLTTKLAESVLNGAMQHVSAADDAYMW